MKKIFNPFKNRENYFCFGCSPHNQMGLQMEFLDNGSEIICEWQPKDYLQGYDNILHGGIQSTLMDEIASWFVYTKLETGGVTSRISVRYKRPVFTNKGKIKITAELKEVNKNLANITTKIFDPDGKLCSEGEIQYFIMSKEQAVEKLKYPGIESFYNN
ncbi:MAG: PaaI family thioesterase [Ignavibacteriales bacterium]|nr:PaaI family thioesterase [Ignavibacteriales bacterium]